MRLRQPGVGGRRAQPAQVAAGRRPERGVDRRGRRPLELAHLGGDLVRRDHERVGQRVAQDLGDARLVRGIEEREEQADGDGLGPLALQPPRGAMHARLVERADHAVRPHPLVHLDAAAALDHRRRRRLVQAVQARPRLAAEEQEVAEALGGDERGAGETARQQRVGGDRRAVDEVRDVGRPEACAGERLACGRDHSLLLALRGQHLGGHHPVLGDEHGVGERAADVHPEHGHASTASAAWSPRRTA